MKKMIKRALSLSMAAVMAAAVVTGCGSDSNTGAAKDGKKSVTLTFGSHQSGLPTSGIVQDLGKEFEAETGTKIDLQHSYGPVQCRTDRTGVGEPHGRQCPFGCLRR